MEGAERRAIGLSQRCVVGLHNIVPSISKVGASPYVTLNQPSQLLHRPGILEKQGMSGFSSLLTQNNNAVLLASAAPARFHFVNPCLGLLFALSAGTRESRLDPASQPFHDDQPDDRRTSSSFPDIHWQFHFLCAN